MAKDNLVKLLKPIMDQSHVFTFAKVGSIVSVIRETDAGSLPRDNSVLLVQIRDCGPWVGLPAYVHVKDVVPANNGELN